MKPDERTEAKKLPRAVWVLGWVSLLMDTASEMLYPIGPIYLTVVLGAPVGWLGVIEGLAEAVAGISKNYFGALSDALGRRRPLVSIGYALSALSKPLPALVANVTGVLGARVVDRIGKGIRTAPRDALLASYVDADRRGAAFGLHRAMDTIGAAIGPAVALLYLWLRPGDYAGLFLLAFIPSALAALATLLVRDRCFTPDIQQPGLLNSFSYWRRAPEAYRKVLFWLGLFALANSSDMFLILRARQLGFNTTTALVGYILYNIVYAAAAWPAGQLSDKLGRKRVLVCGLLLYAGVYAGFALVQAPAATWGLFACYGIYAAMTESVAKAWLGDFVGEQERGSALGLYAALASVGTMLASFWTGFLWQSAGAPVALMVAAFVALISGAGLALSKGASQRRNLGQAI